MAWGLGIVLLVFHNKDVCELDGEDSIIGAGLGLNVVYDGCSKSNLSSIMNKNNASSAATKNSFLVFETPRQATRVHPMYPGFLKNNASTSIYNTFERFSLN